MIKINYMSTLFVGIDVSSKSNVVCAMDFDENQYISSSFKNNQPGADELAKMILECMKIHSNLNTIVVALESTSVYSIHIANFLSTCEVLMPYKPYVFCLNPKATASNDEFGSLYPLNKNSHPEINLKCINSFNKKH